MGGKKKIIDELKRRHSKADAIYLGPDPTREGEAMRGILPRRSGEGKDRSTGCVSTS